MLRSAALYLIVVNALAFYAPISFGAETCQIKVAVGEIAPPFMFDEEDGKQVGILVDLYKLLSNDMDCHFKLMALPVPRIDTEGAAGRVDMSFSMEAPVSGN